MIAMKSWMTAGAALLLSLPGHAGIFGPSNYDECITDSMKGVSSNVAAQAIIKSCRNQFPPPKVPPSTPASQAEPLSDTELELLDAELIPGPGSRTMGSVYNGSYGWRITEIMINVSHKENGKTVSRRYRVDIGIPPLATGAFEFFPIGEWDKDSRWHILSARGIRQ